MVARGYSVTDLRQMTFRQLLAHAEAASKRDA